jgi:hypothetical protein
MRRSLTATAGAPLVAAVTLLILICAEPSAQRRGGAAANPGVPIATNTILQNPDEYYGKQVTISAGVEQILSKTAFLIDQWKGAGTTEVKAIGKPILVIAPSLTAPLDQKHYLLMTGQIMKFDPSALAVAAVDYKLDLAPEVGAKFQGQPVLLATSVISSTYTDLTRKPLPPPSAAEISLDEAMKTIGPAFAALRTATQESKADVVAGNAAKLEPAFTVAETIWDNLGQSGPAEWAREARDDSASIESAAAAGNWDVAKLTAGALNQVCQNCHAAYREKQDDGTFRIKPGSF